MGLPNGMWCSALLRNLAPAVSLAVLTSAAPMNSSAGPDSSAASSASTPAVDQSPQPQVVECAQLHPSPGWPVWIKDYRTSARTEETSGIAYVGRDVEGRRCFFLIDDVGAFHFCRVAQKADSGEVTLFLEPVGIDQSLLDDLNLNEKLDFEALSLDPRALTQSSSRRDGNGTSGSTWAPGDKSSGTSGFSSDREDEVGAADLQGDAFPDTLPGILSIEGRGRDFQERTRVLSVRFIRTRNPYEGLGETTLWRVASLGDAIAETRFWRRSVASNRGFEGLGISDRYYFLGLESLDAKGELNLYGTVLFIYDRVSAKVAAVRTKPLGIHSITGMLAINDTVTVLVDRSRQAICVLKWDAQPSAQLRSCHRFPLDLPGPGGFRYAIPAVEGLTVDGDGDLWCVTDPWRGHYRVVGTAPESIHVYLAAELPMMYRFSGDPVWEAVGLTSLWGADDGTEP
ncbi:MAG: hypothetical protein KAY24_13415 [Candidatus Eisenbacteria sp.]|nr:hypothetical protein [Candidatus Eisenbacteria bacterium]